MATIAEVRDRAAQDLGILGLNQTLQSQDSTRITSAYNEVHAQLKKDGLATWTSTGSIPTECVPYVANLVANNCLSTYSIPNDRYTRIKNEVRTSMRELMKLASPDWMSVDDVKDY